MPLKKKEKREKRKRENNEDQKLKKTFYPKKLLSVLG